MTPKEYALHRSEVLQEIVKLQYNLRENRPGDNIPQPENMRPAVKDDIVKNAVLWYPASKYREKFWRVVDEVLYPYDDWKGYTAEDGCRLGLSGAFVEVV